MTALIACPHCNEHARVDEANCPHCGGRMRGRDGRIDRTARAVLLGLSVAGAVGAGAACSAPKYGAPPAPEPIDTSMPEPTPAEPAPTASANTTPGGMGGAGEPEPATEYGVPAPPD